MARVNTADPRLFFCKKPLRLLHKPLVRPPLQLHRRIRPYVSYNGSPDNTTHVISFRPTSKTETKDTNTEDCHQVVNPKPTLKAHRTKGNSPHPLPKCA